MKNNRYYAYVFRNGEIFTTDHARYKHLYRDFTDFAPFACQYPNLNIRAHAAENFWNSFLIQTVGRA